MKDSNDRLELPGRLHSKPPPGATSFDSSGLDCLVVVLRHIFTYVPREHLSFDANAIVKYAQLAFDPADSPEAIDGKKRSVLDKFLGYNTDKPVTFSHLCGSDEMLSSIWSDPPFNLFRQLLVPVSAEADVAQFKAVDWPRSEIPHASLVIYNPSEEVGRSLQDVVMGKAGGFLNEDGIERHHILGHPAYVRVLFGPSEKDEEMFEQLRSFMLPIYEILFETPTEARLNTLYYQRYSLIAVVRMRQGDHEKDLVRTYSLTGRNNSSDYPENDFTRNSWSLNHDSEHFFMLFYATAGDAPLRAYLEVEPRPVPMQSVVVEHMRALCEAFRSSRDKGDRRSAQVDNREQPITSEPGPLDEGLWGKTNTTIDQKMDQMMDRIDQKFDQMMDRMDGYMGQIMSQLKTMQQSTAPQGESSHQEKEGRSMRK